MDPWFWWLVAGALLVVALIAAGREPRLRAYTIRCPDCEWTWVGVNRWPEREAVSHVIETGHGLVVDLPRLKRMRPWGRRDRFVRGGR